MCNQSYTAPPSVLKGNGALFVERGGKHVDKLVLASAINRAGRSGDAAIYGRR
jgi:hypothetical protein